MQTKSFTCEIVSPVFMNGADTRSPSLRSSGLKGILRFWWRAAHPNLENAERKLQEQQIFGGTLSLGDKKDKVTQARKSSLIIQVRSQASPTPNDLIPHKRDIGNNSRTSSFGPGESFEILFRLRQHGFTSLKKLEALLKLSAFIGGIGRRTRRGMGAFKILPQGDEKVPETIEEVLQEIEGHLQTLNSGIYTLDTENQSISPTTSYSQPYPFIQHIQIGKKPMMDFDELLVHIGKCTNRFHADYAGDSYKKALGSGQPRFASPVYVSIVQIAGAFHPIISLLNSAPPEKKLQRARISPNSNTIRTSFIKSVLQLP